ncbi:MAG: DNA polymerase IV [Myxococcales bacterium]|nr:DNA polymerase IV [Myxococcales bacterium]
MADPRHIVCFHVHDFPIEVERIRDRRLRERPVALVPKTGSRAVVVAASREARADGVYEGMPVPLARRYCPKLQILLPDDALYQRAQTAMADVLGRYSPLVEPEAHGRLYIDLTGTRRLLGEAKNAGWKMRREIADRLRLSGDLGLATNKLISRVAGDLVRDGIWDVLPGGEAPFLAPLPPWHLPGIGAAQARRLLEELNLRSVGQIAAVDPAHLEMAFGAFGAVLWQRSRGIDPRPVLPPARVPHAMAETLLAEDTNDDRQLAAALWILAEQLGRHLRLRGKLPLALQLTARFSDGRDQTRTVRPAEPSNLDLDLAAVLKPAAAQLFARRVRLRYLRLQAPQLADEDLQRGLFGDSPAREQSRALHRAIDRLREKYGDPVIRWGTVALAEKLREPTAEKAE